VSSVTGASVEDEPVGDRWIVVGSITMGDSVVLVGDICGTLAHPADNTIKMKIKLTRIMVAPLSTSKDDRANRNLTSNNSEHHT
jgi:preprotein translocase subunit YajC